MRGAFILMSGMCMGGVAYAAALVSAVGEAAHARHLSYFEEVYQLMRENYYFEVSRSDFERFLKVFDEKLYASIVAEGKSDDYVRWRSAAYLVDALKQPDDMFSRYLPPKPAQEFSKEVYGKRIDLGIEGRRTDKGYVIDFIEPRSDAYEKGMRPDDVIVNIDGKSVVLLDEAGIRDGLNPLEGTKVVIDYLTGDAVGLRTVGVISREYFKQTVFEKPTDIPGIYCLQIQKFNQGTPEDFGRLMGQVAVADPKGLIIDLRGNPGGPPLAARAISAFFLPNGEGLVYFEGRNRPRSDLDIPIIPSQYHVAWPMVVLVNRETGSASELFSGVLQARKRAVILGEKTAGQVLLKSMFDLSDGSQLALVNARGHFPDGRPFPFDGVVPDERMPFAQDADAINLAAKYLYLKIKGRL